jgi:hypothetical protein
LQNLLKKAAVCANSHTVLPAKMKLSEMCETATTEAIHAHMAAHPPDTGDMVKVCKPPSTCAPVPGHAYAYSCRPCFSP